MCETCNHHRACHNQPISSPSTTSTSPLPLFLPLKRPPPTLPPVSPTHSPSIPTAPALTNPKKKQHKLTEQFKAHQLTHHYTHVHQLGYGQLVPTTTDSSADGSSESSGHSRDGGSGEEGGEVVEVRLNGSGASVWLPRAYCTDTCWVHVRSFHNFQPKNNIAASSASVSPATSSASPSPSTPAAAGTTVGPALSPTHSSSQPASPLSSFTIEVDLNSSLLVGLVHPIMDAYAQHGVELEEEEVRLIANGRELTFASTATSASTLLADCPHLVPFSTLLLIYDPQSSFTLDPLSSTSPSLVLSSNLLTVSITSDSKWCSIRASHPFTRGLHTWRLRMNQCTSGNVFVGVCTEQAKMSQYLGNDASGFGYYGCVTGDHRVLTRRGWRSIGEIKVADRDEVLSFNTTTYEQEWKLVTGVTSHDVDPQQDDDRLFRMQGAYMDVVATKDHSMLLAHLSAHRLAKRTPIGYTKVAQLLPPNLSYKVALLSTHSRFSYNESRLVVGAGSNSQKSHKVRIGGMLDVCDWWWQRDEQVDFLSFLGFWLGDGYLFTPSGHVCIGQKKEKGKEWLEKLLNSVFPGWWSSRQHTTAVGMVTYSIRCPPLYEYLRAMAVGPLGYNPKDPAELRAYPHFTYNAGLAEEEKKSSYYKRYNTGGYTSTWTESDMLTAMKKAAQELFGKAKRKAGGRQDDPPASSVKPSASLSGAASMEVEDPFAFPSATSSSSSSSSSSSFSSPSSSTPLTTSSLGGAEVKVSDDEPLIVDVINEEGDTMRIPCADAVEDEEGSEEVRRALRAQGKVCWYFPPTYQDQTLIADETPSLSTFSFSPRGEGFTVQSGTDMTAIGAAAFAQDALNTDPSLDSRRVRHLSQPWACRCGVAQTRQFTHCVACGRPNLPPSGGDVEQGGAAFSQVAAAQIVQWNNGLWIIINGSWFYLKRWLGGEQTIKNVYSRLSKKQAVALLDGFCRADGRWATIQYEDDDDKSKPHEPTGTWHYQNSSFPLVDHLQLISQLAGARTTLRLLRKAGKSTKIDGRTVTFSVDHWQLRSQFTQSKRDLPFKNSELAEPIAVTGDVDGRGSYQYKSDNRVYCITVESDAQRSTSNFLTQRLSVKRVGWAPKKDDKGEAVEESIGVFAHPVFIGNCGNTYRQGSSRSYGSAYRTGDVITVMLDCDGRKLSFRKNDESLGVAFEDLPSSLYPALSLYSKNDSVSIIDFGNT